MSHYHHDTKWRLVSTPFEINAMSMMLSTGISATSPDTQGREHDERCGDTRDGAWLSLDNIHLHLVHLVIFAKWPTEARTVSFRSFCPDRKLRHFLLLKGAGSLLAKGRVLFSHQPPLKLNRTLTTSSSLLTFNSLECTNRDCSVDNLVSSCTSCI